jgi:hypothetical protein
VRSVCVDKAHRMHIAGPRYNCIYNYIWYTECESNSKYSYTYSGISGNMAHCSCLIYRMAQIRHARCTAMSKFALYTSSARIFGVQASRTFILHRLVSSLRFLNPPYGSEHKHHHAGYIWYGFTWSPASVTGGSRRATKRLSSCDPDPRMTLTVNSSRIS